MATIIWPFIVALLTRPNGQTGSRRIPMRIVGDIKIAGNTDIYPGALEIEVENNVPMGGGKAVSYAEIGYDEHLLWNGFFANEEAAIQGIIDQLCEWGFQTQ